ncbi:hypothetical protein Xish_02174 [Xenorhabdus ishibashii]|uniref:Uncharacterized protein n=1 Tax=Xenorhabdus ishibashii TaxID=1034471 RepID=A0A2D0KHN6_9GAMM|nr:hypothetical protein Xish_02174 [Xenorhabdus ishibashii]
MHVSSSSNSVAINGAQFNGQGIGLTETNGFDMIGLANSEQAKELLGFFNRVSESVRQIIQNWSLNIITIVNGSTLEV